VKSITATMSEWHPAAMTGHILGMNNHTIHIGMNNYDYDLFSLVRAEA
jgi:hypothetical protein